MAVKNRDCWLSSFHFQASSACIFTSLNTPHVSHIPVQFHLEVRQTNAETAAPLRFVFTASTSEIAVSLTLSFLSATWFVVDLRRLRPSGPKVPDQT